MVRYEQACKLFRDADLEAKKCQVLRDKCWSELQDARLKFSNVMFGKDFDARGLRDKADPPVRLNRANNSWEEL